MKLGPRDKNSFGSLVLTFMRLMSVDNGNIKQVSSEFCFPCQGVNVNLRYNNIIVTLPLGFRIFVFRMIFGVLFSYVGSNVGFEFC